MPSAPPAFTRLGAGFDVHGTLLEVIAGEGGDDAKLFAFELFRAYLACIDRLGVTGEIEEAEGGKYSVLVADGRARTLLSAETGIHCIQRIPKNERSGRKQTSYVSVLVTDLVTHGYELTESDLTEVFQRGHGKGGQHQNKTSSAVRLRHRPTGLEVFINGRSQQANRATARTCLAAKVKALLHEQAATARPGFQGAGRGTKVRTYNLIENRVADHRTGRKCHRPASILKEGRFDLLQ